MEGRDGEMEGEGESAQNGKEGNSKYYLLYAL